MPSRLNLILMPVQQGQTEQLSLTFYADRVLPVTRQGFAITALQQPQAASTAAVSSGDGLVATVLSALSSGTTASQLPAYGKPPHLDCKGIVSGLHSPWGAWPGLNGAARILSAADGPDGQLQMQLPQLPPGAEAQINTDIASKTVAPRVSLHVLQGGMAEQQSEAVTRFRLDGLQLAGPSPSGFSVSQLWFGPPPQQAQPQMPQPFFSRCCIHFFCYFSPLLLLFTSSVTFHTRQSFCMSSLRAQVSSLVYSFNNQAKYMHPTPLAAWQAERRQQQQPLQQRHRRRCQAQCSGQESTWIICSNSSQSSKWM